jgi:hypothetical protein
VGGWWQAVGEGLPAGDRGHGLVADGGDRGLLAGDRGHGLVADSEGPGLLAIGGVGWWRAVGGWAAGAAHHGMEVHFSAKVHRGSVTRGARLPG